MKHIYLVFKKINKYVNFIFLESAIIMTVNSFMLTFPIMLPLFMKKNIIIDLKV